jgi:hypothetical protein
VSENTARAGSERVVAWSARRGIAPITFTSSLNDPVALQSQDGRRTLAFARTGAGLTGTWGPFASAAFTLAVVVRLDGMATDYGTVPGLGGTLPLLVSPQLTVSVPTGGGGPVPWDALFLNHWRILMVRNDAATARTVFVDKQHILTTTPSTGVVGVGDTVVIGAAFPGEIAELVVWDGALHATDVDAFAEMLGQKWNTAALPSVPRFAIPNAVGDTWPSDVVPSPTVWLDAAHPASLFADAAATIATVAHGRVARWWDRSGNGHHVTFAPDGKTYWATGGAEQINGLPVVSVADTNPGSFTGGNPLATAVNGAFLMVAVWRLTGSGGHPFSVRGVGTFTADAWVDAVGSNSFRTMTAPNTLSPFPVHARDVVVVVWERNATGVLQIRIHNITDDESSGSIYSASGNTDSNWLTDAVSVGSSDKGLHLAELLIWCGTVPNNAARTALRVYLARRWGPGVLPTGGVLTTNALPTDIGEAVTIRYLRLTRTVGSDYMNIRGLHAYYGSRPTISLTHDTPWRRWLCASCARGHRHCNPTIRPPHEYKLASIG